MQGLVFSMVNPDATLQALSEIYYKILQPLHVLNLVVRAKMIRDVGQVQIFDNHILVMERT